ncbi:hypothetical protein M0805_003050 [Coniferiporia weirii]|nr:hypothetical protein M0805_003050 [Coniferiporia weirii]
MVLRLFRPLSVISLAIRFSYAENVQGDNFCGDLMCVTAFVNSSTITYQMTALNQMGWMATGFGTQMEDARMVIMWTNSDGSITLSQRTAAGLVEPEPDPSPPRVATTYLPLTVLPPTFKRLSFTVSKDDTESQSAIWALGFGNPNSTSPNATLLIHAAAGAFTLNLTNMIDPDSVPSFQNQNSSDIVFSPSSSVASSSSITTSPQPTGGSGGSDVISFASFERIAISHAVLSVLGFLVILPAGALIARWCRTYMTNWFYYHWIIQVVFSIPAVVTGWSLGPLAVAAQGTRHGNDVHKVIGLLLLPLYLIQLCVGTYVHLRKPPYLERHPPRNIVHGVLGILIVGLAFFQARTGITVEWSTATSRTIDLNFFSNLWIAWTILVPLAYFAGFLLLPRQLVQERELPPPYSPETSESESGSGFGMRRLLGLDPVDDGTHDIFSEGALSGDNASSQEDTASGSVATSDGTEMREVPVERWAPISLASSLSRPS